jgi:hypothetical protein
LFLPACPKEQTMEGIIASAALALLGGALGIVGWQLKRLLTNTADNNSELIKLRILLTGEDGNNGIKGRVDAIEKGLHNDRNRAQERLLLWRIWASHLGGFLTTKYDDFEPPSLEESPRRRAGDNV